MTRTRRTLLAALAPWIVALALAACGDTGAEPAPDAPGDATALDTSTSPPDTSAADTSLCTPDAIFCVSPREAGVCNAAGDGAASVTPCLGATACEPASGLCRPTICEPDKQECLNLQTYQVCASDGSGWGAVATCPPELFCADGRCRACQADRFECLSETTYRQCASDSSAWSDTLDCPDDHTCLGQACEPCDLTTECVGETRMRRYCANPLIDLDETLDCGAGQTCTGGRCFLCEPDEVACVTESSSRKCDPDGLSWLPEVACADDAICLDAGCVPEECAPRVLLLVDKSGSMSSHWQSVRQSVATLAGANPTVRFGLKSFPSGSSSCDVNAALDVPFAQHNAGALDDWFEEFGPTSLTPLVAGVEAVSDNAAALFEGQVGSLIVLSDGQDTCSSSSSVKIDLAIATSGLFIDHGVTSYAIGYAFGGDVGELDTIANNGGTDYFTHIAAGDEAELTAAFGEVIDDIKVCDPTAGP